MHPPSDLHTAFLNRFTEAWIHRDPTEMEGFVTDDLVVVLRPGSEPVVGKDTVIHRLGNLWVVQQDVWTDWAVISDSDDQCRIIGRAGFTNAAYFTKVAIDGTITVVFRDGLAAHVYVDVAARWCLRANASSASCATKVGPTRHEPRGSPLSIKHVIHEPYD